MPAPPVPSRNRPTRSGGPFWRGCVALLLGLGSPACDGADGGADRPLEMVIPNDITSADPRFTIRGYDVKLSRLVHAGLVGLHPSTLEPVPLVAKSWQAPDERTLVMQLRPGLRFHSGAKLEPEDVCATIRALQEPSLGSPHRAVVRSIGSCQPEPPLGLRIVLMEARATLLTDLEVPILRRDQAAILPERLSAPLDGLGPYRIGKMSPGEVQLEPSGNGPLPKPARRLVVRTVHDANARALRLLVGKSDIAPNAISPVLLPSLVGRDGLEVTSRPGANVSYLLLQNERPPLDRLEVRRALSAAIDRRSITRYLFADMAQPAAGIFPAEHWAAPDSLVVPQFSPDQARSVLSGLPELTLYTSTDRARVTVARAMAQMLEDAGATVRVVPLDLGVLLHRVDTGEYELASLQFPELTEPNILKWFFHPSGVPGEGGEGKNRARYRSTVVGRLLDQASEVSDRRQRQQAYFQVAQEMAQDLPVIPLWHEDQVAVVSKRAKGFRLSAEGRWLAVAALP
ncbi:MAG: ABC transporter substrate-binding protein [Polyangiaceae bacterium]|nr:ABC transporter substrate-binding protein [Polyangiaceae bacterium]